MESCLVAVAGVPVANSLILSGQFAFLFVQNHRHSTMIRHDPCHPFLGQIMIAQDGTLYIDLGSGTGVVGIGIYPVDSTTP